MRAACVCRARVEMLCPCRSAKCHLERIRLLIKGEGAREFLFSGEGHAALEESAGHSAT